MTIKFRDISLGKIYARGSILSYRCITGSRILLLIFRPQIIYKPCDNFLGYKLIVWIFKESCTPLGDRISITRNFRQTKTFLMVSNLLLRSSRGNVAKNKNEVALNIKIPLLDGRISINSIFRVSMNIT